MGQYFSYAFGLLTIGVRVALSRPAISPADAALAEELIAQKALFVKPGVPE